MRIVALSDTHNKHDRVHVPEGDVLIHAGDLTVRGTPKEIFDALAWLSRLPHKPIIVTPGNHDAALQQEPHLVGVLKSKFPRVEVLIDQETVLEGFRVWASPFQPWFHDWAYTFASGPLGQEQAQNKWDEIPDDTAILVTHGPPYGILDSTLRGHHVGCSALKARISRLSQLHLHVFGHVHESYGTLEQGDVLYVNACSCDSQLSPSQPPIVIDVDENGVRPKQ